MKKFIRKYVTSEKTHEIGEIVEIEDEKIVAELLKDGTIKEFSESKNYNILEKRVVVLEKENRNLKELLSNQKELGQGISNDTVYEILEILTVKDLEKIAVSKNITLETDLKEEKIKEILKAL